MKTTQPHPCSPLVTFRNADGVTLIQFALIFPLLMLFVLAVIDFGRILLIKALLTKGAENGLNLAVKLPNLDLDLRTLDPTSIEYQRYLYARQLVMQAAAELPLNTMVSDSNTPSSAQLVGFSYTDPGGEPFTAPVAFLRPGERVELGTTGSGKWLEHKTFPPRDNAGTLPTQPPELLLKSEPVYVELRATIETFLPMLNGITIVGNAMGVKEQVPRGPIIAPGSPDSTTSTTIFEASTTTTIPYFATTTTTLPDVCVPNWVQCLNFPAPRCPNFNAPGPGPCSPTCASLGTDCSELTKLRTAGY